MHLFSCEKAVIEPWIGYTFRSFDTIQKLKTLFELNFLTLPVVYEYTYHIVTIYMYRIEMTYIKFDIIMGVAHDVCAMCMHSIHIPLLVWRMYA